MEITTLKFNNLSFDFGQWVLFFMILGALISRGFFYRKRVASWLWLSISYGTLLVFLLAIYLRPSLLTRVYSQDQAKGLVLVDDSLSMGFKGSGSEKRWDQLQGALKGIKTMTFDKEIFGFSGKKSPKLPEYDSSSPIKSLKELRALGKTFDWVWLLSDGKFELKEEELKTFPSPIHSSLIESGETRDLGIERANLPEFAFVHNPIKFKVKVFSRNIKSGTLRFYLNEKLKEEKSLDLSNKNNELEFSFTPRKVGKQLIEIRLSHEKGETTYKNNNLFHLLTVNRDRVRVLQVTGQPSYDVRFLREYLKRNPSVDLISFFILRTPMDTPKVPNNELSLIPFPTNELFTKQLHTFDVIIFQNFNFKPYNVRIYLRNIRRFLKDNGGAFIMVGGPLSFSDGDYARTPIEDILPVSLDPKKSVPSYKREGLFSLEKGPAKEGDFILGDFFEEGKVPGYFPRFRGLNLGASLKSGAKLLLETERGQPVVVLKEIGKGRSAAILTDNFWQLNFSQNPQDVSKNHYVFFWRNILAWLMKEQKEWLKNLSLSREKKNEQKKIRFQGLIDKKDLNIEFSDWSKSKRKIKKIKKLQKEAFYEFFIPNTWQEPIRMSLSDGKDKKSHFLITKNNLKEFWDSQNGEETLKKLSKLSGGKILDLDDIGAAGDEMGLSKKGQISDESITEIWDKKSSFFFFLLLLFNFLWFEKKAGL